VPQMPSLHLPLSCLQRCGELKRPCEPRVRISKAPATKQRTPHTVIPNEREESVFCVSNYFDNPYEADKCCVASKIAEAERARLDCKSRFCD